MADDQLSDSGVNITFALPTPIGTVDATKFSTLGTPWSPSGTITQISPTVINLTFFGWSADTGGDPYAVLAGLAPGIAPSTGIITP